MPEKSPEEEEFEFVVEEETLPQIKNHAGSCGAVLLSIIAPFLPLRVAPERAISAEFGFPDEFVLEDFLEKVYDKYPDKEKRPPLHILIHSPGGTMSTSYVTARVLRDNFNEIIALVPHVASSGATVLALSCNRVVFGSISHFSGINPIRGKFNPLSTLRAFDKLEDELKNLTEGEISYPLKHLLSTITAEKLDEANHSMVMVDSYMHDLMKKAGYKIDDIHNVLDRLLWHVHAHEQVFMYGHAKELGINVEYYRDSHYAECWKVARIWLHKYYLEPSPSHVIKYCLPSSPDTGNNPLIKGT